MNDVTATGKDKLISDLKVVVEDAEDLMRMSTAQASLSAADARAQVKAQLTQAREELVRMQEASLAKAKALGHNTDVYVHENPWRSIAVAAGCGVVLGVLLGRK